MRIQNINNTNFGMKYKLSNETLKQISTTTKLSVEELHSLPMDEAVKLMKERGSIKEPNKFKLWISDIYRKFGEKMGFLQKEYPIYSDGD